MKFLFTVSFIVFLQINLFSQNTQYIVIDKEDDLNKLSSLSSCPVDLTFNRFRLTAENLKKIESNTNLNVVVALSINNMTNLTGGNFEKFLNCFDSDSLTKLFISGISQLYKINLSTNIFTNLTELRITGSTIHSSFLNGLLTSSSDKLKTLDLNGTEIDDDMIKNFNQWKGMKNLEYLDISGNKAGNKLLTILPADRLGSLKTLKMNNCDLTIDKSKKYSSEFPALSYTIEKTLPCINWAAPFFKNLEHLEIENEVTENDDPALLHQDTVLSKLKRFLGFKILKYQLLFNYDQEDVSERKKRTIANNQFKRMMDTPIKSAINNYEFYTMSMVNTFAQSSMAQTTENIIFKYRSWDIESIEAVLSNANFKSLKRILILKVNATQKELLDLINLYPQYDFEIEIFNEFDGNGAYIKREPYFWPRIEVNQ